MLGAALPDGFRGAVRYTGVDASQAQRARCAETLAVMGGRLGAAALQGQILDPEGLAVVHGEETFDLVFLLHVLYYVDDPIATLRAALARVAPGGRLLIWHAPCEEMNQLASVFWAPQRPQPIPFAAEVERALDALGCRYTVARVAAALAVEPHGHPEAREDIVSFLIQADARRLPPELRAELDRAVDHIRRPDGAIPHPVCCFVVEPA